LPEATAATPTLLATAQDLLAAAMPTIQLRGITLIGVTFGSLDDDSAIQLALPFDRPPGQMDATLDAVKERFGSAAVTRAVLLGRRDRPSVPLLPD
jgi:DNA polymerase-4